MNAREKKLIKETYADCIRLKKKGELTEFGEGQLVLCELLL